jgi:hypothetical protein
MATKRKRGFRCVSCNRKRKCTVEAFCACGGFICGWLCPSCLDRISKRRARRNRNAI